MQSAKLSRKAYRKNNSISSTNKFMRGKQMADKAAD